MIPLIILLILIPFPIMNGTSAIYAEEICSPTEISPFYNCNEPTYLVIWDMLHPPNYNSTSDSFYIRDNATHLASTVYNISHEPTIENNFSVYNVISLGNTHAEQGAGKYDDPWTTSTAHEIRHVKCKCLWHPST